MTGDTVLPIGSITKTFTSLALAMLADEGKLDWDAPVIKYIPWLRLNNQELTENVTENNIVVTIAKDSKRDTTFFILILPKK